MSYGVSGMIMMFTHRYFSNFIGQSINDVTLLVYGNILVVLCKASGNSESAVDLLKISLFVVFCYFIGCNDVSNLFTINLQNSSRLQINKTKISLLNYAGRFSKQTVLSYFAD